MRTVAITGARGFIGRNLRHALARQQGVEVIAIDDKDPGALERAVSASQVVVHLAGVNRPTDPQEFVAGNVELTHRLTELAAACAGPPAIVFSSSIQAGNDSPYGTSKRRAEELVLAYGRRTGAPVFVYRLANVFGKWCRPNYNSVIATFCHNLARGLPIHVTEPDRELELVYVDTVVAALIAAAEGKASPSAEHWQPVTPTHRIRLADLAEKLRAMARIRDTLVLPDLEDDLTRFLHATYVSYLEPTQLAYPLVLRTDHRGALAEIVKSPHAGQMFVSRSKPGVVRGNHYHDTKIEKFLVIEGRAAIKFRAIDGSEVITYEVSGQRPEVVDILPGYTHSIANIGEGELITLFWASEVFDPGRPDTYMLPVETKP